MNSNSTDTKQIRIFGLIALIFFGCLCMIGLWRQKPVPIYLFGALSILGIGFILLPNRLRPVHTGWLKVAHFIGKVITAVILSLAYYLVITPFGLVRRLLKGPILPQRPDKKADTYWVTRPRPLQEKEQFIKRY